MPPSRPTTAPEEWLSRAQAAGLLGCHFKTIENYIARGDLPAYKIRGSRFVRVKRADVEAMLVRIPTVAPASTTPPSAADRIGPSA